MRRKNIYIYLLAVLMWVLLLACGSNITSKNDIKDTNDTNAVFSVNDQPSEKLPAKSNAETKKGKCVMPFMPAEVTYSYIYTFADRSLGKYKMEIKRIKQFESKEQRTYIESMNIIFHRQNERADVTTNSRFDRNKISEFFTITEDGLFEDLKKEIRTGLRSVKVDDNKRKSWAKATNHPSGKYVIKDSKGNVETYHEGNKVTNTYLPYRRRFRKFCVGKSFHEKWTTLMTVNDGKKTVADEGEMGCTVISVDEPFWLPAGNFKAIRLECISKGVKYTDWIDSKTGVWLSHKGDDATMKVLSFSAIR